MRKISTKTLIRHLIRKEDHVLASKLGCFGPPLLSMSSMADDGNQDSILPSTENSADHAISAIN